MGHHGQQVGVFHIAAGRSSVAGIEVAARVESDDTAQLAQHGGNEVRPGGVQAGHLVQAGDGLLLEAAAGRHVLE